MTLAGNGDRVLDGRRTGRFAGGPRTPPAGALGVLVGSFLWGVGWSLAFGLYLHYFPLVGLALLVRPGGSPGEPAN